MLWSIITATEPEDRNRSLDAFCREASAAQLLTEIKELEAHRRTSENLYERVRALFFLYAIYRFHLPAKSGNCSSVRIPFSGYEKLLRRRYEEAISVFLGAQRQLVQATASVARWPLPIAAWHFKRWPIRCASV